MSKEIEQEAKTMLLKQIGIAVTGAATALGLVFAGHGLGQRGLDDRVSSERELAFLKGKEEGERVARQDIVLQLEAAKKSGYEQAKIDLEPSILQRIADARKQGENAGKSEAQQNITTDEYKAETLARLIGIVTSPNVASALPEKTNAAIRKAKNDIEDGDFKSASLVLPDGVEIATKRDCIQTGQAVELQSNSYFVDCSTGTRIASTGRNNIELSYTVNGGEIERLRQGKSVPIADTECVFSVLKILPDEKALVDVAC